MFSILRTSFSRLPAALLPKCTFNCLNYQSTAFFHILSKPNTLNTYPNTFESKLLTPKTLNIVPSCGFKVKGRLKRRCKDCYFVVREKRLFVICKTHPRHKQMSMVPKEKTTWILTAATMGKNRPW